jgi:hypothetical protein
MPFQFYIMNGVLNNIIIIIIYIYINIIVIRLLHLDFSACELSYKQETIEFVRHKKSDLKITFERLILTSDCNIIHGLSKFRYDIS